MHVPVILCRNCGEPAEGTTREQADTGEFPESPCEQCGKHAWESYDLDPDEADEMGLSYEDDETDPYGIEYGECYDCGGRWWKAEGECIDCGAMS